MDYTAQEEKSPEDCGPFCGEPELFADVDAGFGAEEALELGGGGGCWLGEVGELRALAVLEEEEVLARAEEGEESGAGSGGGRGRAEGAEGEYSYSCGWEHCCGGIEMLLVEMVSMERREL